MEERVAGDVDGLGCADFDFDEMGFKEVETLDARSVKDGNKYPLTLEVFRFEPKALKKSKLVGKAADPQVAYYDVILAYHTRFEGFTSLLVDNWLQERHLFRKEYKQTVCRKAVQGNRLVLHAPFYQAGERPDDPHAKERADEMIVAIIIPYIAKQPDNPKPTEGKQPTVAETGNSKAEGGDVVGDLIAGHEGRPDGGPSEKSGGQQEVAGLSPAEELAVKQALQGGEPATEKVEIPAPADAAGQPPEAEAAAGDAPEGGAGQPVETPPEPAPQPRAYPWTAGFHLGEFVDAEEVFVAERVDCGKAGNFIVGAVAQIAPGQAKSKEETVAVRRRLMYAANQFYGAGGDPHDRAAVETSIDPSHFWCVPKREVCYKQVEFGQFGVAVHKDELARVERNQIYNLRLGLAAAIQTMAADWCMNEDNLAGRRAE